MISCLSVSDGCSGWFCARFLLRMHLYKRVFHKAFLCEDGVQDRYIGGNVPSHFFEYGVEKLLESCAERIKRRLDFSLGLLDVLSLDRLCIEFFVCIQKLDRSGKVIVHQSVKVIDDLGVFFGAFEDGAYGVLYLVYCAGYILARNGVVAHANLRDECLAAREQGLRFGG